MGEGLGYIGGKGEEDDKEHKNSQSQYKWVTGMAVQHGEHNQ